MKPSILIFLFVVLTFTPVNAETLSFSMLDNALVRVNYLIIKEAYKKLGMETTYEVYPMERCLRMSDSGESDGELARIDGMSDKYPNLIKIPVPISHVEIVVITVHNVFEVRGTDSLKPYSVGIIIGYHQAYELTKDLKRVEAVAKLDSLVKKLDAKRNDIGVLDRMTTLDLMERFPDIKLKILEPPLKRVPTYHYVHKKHQHLVKDLTNILKNMEDSGELDKLRDKIIKNKLYKY